ncbi:hypothetical protein KM043_012007 [Ampulex compressa]|nr:hypothetical protein KM043_012007 [Ampulex compressa]
MDCCDTDFKEKNVKQMALISKIHSMKWLKNNSQASGHDKEQLPKKCLSKSDSPEHDIHTCSDIEKDEDKVESVEDISLRENTEHQTKLKNESDLSSDKDIDLALLTVESSKKSMEHTWNENTTGTPTNFSSSQSVLIQKLDKEEATDVSLNESSVTANKDQLRSNNLENCVSSTSLSKSNDSTCLLKMSEAEKKMDDKDVSNKCHDNNNNNAKPDTIAVLERDLQAPLKSNIPRLNSLDIKKQQISLSTSRTTKNGANSKTIRNGNKTPNSTLDRKYSSSAPTRSYRSFDKCGRTEEYNYNNRFAERGKTREQALLKSHSVDNKNKSPLPGLNDKTRYGVARPKPSKVESEKRYIDDQDKSKYYKNQLTHGNMHGSQYNRSKSFVKGQQSLHCSTIKVEPKLSRQHTFVCNTNLNVSSTVSADETKTLKVESPKNGDNRKPSVTETLKCRSDLDNTFKENANKSCNDVALSKCQVNNSEATKSAATKKMQCLVCKRTQESVTDHRKPLRKDSTVKQSSARAKCDLKKTDTCQEQKLHCTPSNTPSKKMVIPNSNALKSSTKSSVSSLKPVNSSSINNTISTSLDRFDQASDKLQVSESSKLSAENTIKNTDSQECKSSTYQKSTLNNDNKTHSYPEPRQVQCSESKAASDLLPSLYSNKSEPVTRPTSFCSDMQSLQLSDNTSDYKRQLRNTENKAEKCYPRNNGQYHPTSATNIEHYNWNAVDTLQNENVHAQHTMQSAPSEGACPQSIPVSNGVMHYPNIPGLYMNQYNNIQTTSRRTVDVPDVPQDASIPSSTSVNTDFSNILQTPPLIAQSNHNTVMPPPGFPSLTTPQSQWNYPLQDVLYFGNVISTSQPTNIQMQNNRPICHTGFNNVPQTNYVSHPLLYCIPPVYMQNWNPLLGFPTPLMQTSQFPNCNVLPKPIVQPGQLANPANCTMLTAHQNQLHKQIFHVQQLEEMPAHSHGQITSGNYTQSMQDSAPNSGTTEISDTVANIHMKSRQYCRPAMSQDYQKQVQNAKNYSSTIDSMTRRMCLNMYTQTKQCQSTPSTSNYLGILDTTSRYQYGLDNDNKKGYDGYKNDMEYNVPPMISPRECMYYGVNGSKKADTFVTPIFKPAMHPPSYLPAQDVMQQSYGPDFYIRSSYPFSEQDNTSKANGGQGKQRVMDS